jgi:hypothetical protein
MSARQPPDSREARPGEEADLTTTTPAGSTSAAIVEDAADSLPTCGLCRPPGPFASKHADRLCDRCWAAIRAGLDRRYEAALRLGPIGDGPFDPWTEAAGMSGLSRPGSKARRIQDAVLALLREHATENYGLPTNPRFIAYELEQRGQAVKPSPDDKRPNKRRQQGWPPGFQDVGDELLAVRELGIIPWEWISDAERQLVIFEHAPSVAAYLSDRLDEASINPWHPELPPLILTEAKGVAGVLERPVSAYLCPVGGMKGQAGKGWLITEVAPRLLASNDRAVLYLGDRDRCGEDIERNAHRVLERAAGREIAWKRIGLTEAQTEGIDPIWKVDGRDHEGRWAWEIESLGQAAVVALIQGALDVRLPEPLDRVLEREDEEREELRELLEGGPS